MIYHADIDHINMKVYIRAKNIARDKEGILWCAKGSNSLGEAKNKIYLQSDF